MPTTYSYKVRDTSGQLIKGALEADDRALVLSKLKEMGYVPISIDRKSAAVSSEIVIPGLSHRVSGKEISLFSRQFATLINAGVGLTRSLAILAGQAEKKHFAAIIDQLRSDVERGSSLSQALARHPRHFSRLYVSMVQAGEVSGNLDQTLLDLAATLEKQVELRRKIKSALTYPAAVLTMVVLIMAAMLLFVVPIFKKMYKQLGGTLPTPTRILVGISNLMVHALPFIVIAVLLIAFAIHRWTRTPSGRAARDRLLLKIPVFGGLVQKASLARFAGTLSSLLRSGVPVLEALDITRETSGNTLVAAGVDAIAQGTRQGGAMADSLHDHPVFPPMVTQMISVGEETGALDDLLKKIATFLEQEVEATVNALTSLLEPIMIVIIGSAVGATVISLYLPMFDIYKLVANSG